jgi:single-strand DNA-binding protein
MPSFNKVMMIGNLTRDPQVKHLPSQTVLAEFGLAMSRKYRLANGEDREEVCFVDCTAFGRQAETIAQYCKKGKQIFIEGRLKYDSWEDKGSAIGGPARKRSKLSVVVENFQFLGSRDSDSSANITAPVDDRQVAATARPTRVAAQQPFGDEKVFEEADIPF